MLKKIKVRHDVISIRELTPDLVKIWDGLQDLDSALCSPFFSSGFAGAVGRCRDDLRVAVLQEDGEVAGMLPFHLKRGGCAVPVAGQVCDYQGVIGRLPGCGARGQDLLRSCGLAAYDYNHGLAAQDLLAGNAFSFSESRRADLRGGLDAWQAAVKAQTKELGKLGRKERKLEREIGPLRYVANDPSDAAWNTFEAWKDEALRRQGAGGFDRPDWLTALFSELRAADTPRFGGMFSTLYAGDRLIAAHFGMRSHKAWHWWFPTYDASLSKLSPGLILLVHCIEEAAGMGLEELDFGRGTQLFKRQFGTHARALCEGSLERPAAPFGALRAARKSVQRLANRALPERPADILRRGGTKVLRAGLI